MNCDHNFPIFGSHLRRSISISTRKTNMFVLCFIERNTYIRPNDSSNNSYTTTATIPYIRGTSETIAHILRPYNIRVAHKPIFTLRRLITNVKGKDKPEDRSGAVYKIHCSDCQATTRLTEYKRATKKGDLNNNIAEHHLKTCPISTGTLLRVKHAVRTTINELHSKAGLLT